MRRLAGFVLAGGAGFVCDAAVLTLLTAWLGIDPYSARVVSFLTAMMLTWQINRRATFDPSGRPVLSEGMRFGAVALAVGLFNYCAYALMLICFPGLAPVAALTVASAASMTLSYLGYSRLVFSRRR